MKLLPFKAVYPNLDLIASSDSFFGTVKSQFVDYKKSGFFKKSESESIFVYRLKTKSTIHIGIVGCTDIQDIINEKVLKHENTLAPKEQQMMNLMLQNQAMVKPVLLAYDRVAELDELMNTVIRTKDVFLEVNFEANGEKHSLWALNDDPISNEIIRLFRKKVKRSYIADGHHRVKTAILLHQTDKKNEMMDTRLKSVLSLYFSWDDLNIYDYNRCVEIFQTVSPLQFLVELSHVCKITKLKSKRKPKKKHEMTMLIYGEWYRLVWKKKILNQHKDHAVLFDTFLLNEYVLKKIVGIENVRDDFRVKYLDGVVGIPGLEELVAKSENRVGFCMFPIPFEHIKAVADQGQTLPPKSTWFEPRVKNGLLVKEF
ncbi:MAG: DUF1015 family protein [Saprospiraceae bacterium]|nr:DUF1015 family protein [Saprospiraceae bacterium]